MALTVSLLGVNYSVPEPGDPGYDAALTSYLKALATAFPQLSGGVQSLTAELDFGTSFGLKAAWYKSETVNPASAGQVRLAKTDTIKVRNNANSADLALGIDTGDALLWNGANVTGNPMLGATTGAGQSIPNSTSTIVVFGTVELDTDSGYVAGTGRYTVPTGKGGHYEIAGTIQWNAALAATTTSLSITKNATIMKTGSFIAPGALQTVSVVAILNLVAGDVIDLRVSQNQGGPQVLSTTVASNFFALKRIPT